MTNTEINDLTAAAECLRTGGILLYPTDTVWGLGCDARNTEAVSRLFELKQRPESKAMLLLCADLHMVEKYVAPLSEAVKRMLGSFNRPTTIVYPGARGISSQLIAADGSIGIRVPADDFCVKLCRLIDGPIVSTSANIAGHPGASVYDEIQPEVLAMADYVCHTGRNRKASSPSNIIKVNPDGSTTPIRITDPEK